MRVADRGAGLDAADRGRAFDRFWRCEGVEADGGTGLGLAIVARVVAASGGAARLDDRPGWHDRRRDLPDHRRHTPGGTTDG